MGEPNKRTRESDYTPPMMKRSRSNPSRKCRKVPEAKDLEANTSCCSDDESETLDSWGDLSERWGDDITNLLDSFATVEWVSIPICKLCNKNQAAQKCKYNECAACCTQPDCLRHYKMQ